MEEIKKEVKREIIDHLVYYKATDGTEFKSREECQQYEGTATAALLAQLNECLIIKDPDCNMLDADSDDEFKVIIPKNENHIKALNQLWFIYGGRQDLNKPLFSSEHIDTVVIICYRIYNHKMDWLWFYKFNEEVLKITDNRYKLILNK